MFHHQLSKWGHRSTYVCPNKSNCAASSVDSRSYNALASVTNQVLPCYSSIGGYPWCGYFPCSWRIIVLPYAYKKFLSPAEMKKLSRTATAFQYHVFVDFQPLRGHFGSDTLDLAKHVPPCPLVMMILTRIHFWHFILVMSFWLLLRDVFLSCYYLVNCYLMLQWEIMLLVVHLFIICANHARLLTLLGQLRVRHGRGIITISSSVRWPCLLVIGGVYTYGYRNWSAISDILGLLEDFPAPDGYPPADVNHSIRLLSEGDPLELHICSALFLM